MRLFSFLLLFALPAFAQFECLTDPRHGGPVRYAGDLAAKPHVFQSLMPTAGWLGGSLFGYLVQTYGRCLAALLLFGIGGKMVWEAFRKNGEEEKISGFNVVRLIVLSFATSIDALLIGVGYACLKRESILADVLIIGFVTFLISGAGCIAGRRGGRLIGNRCEALGGLVLIGIGVKVLLLD